MAKDNTENDRNISIRLNGKEIENPIARKIVAGLGFTTGGLVLIASLGLVLVTAVAIGMSIFALAVVIVGVGAALIIPDCILKGFGRKGFIRQKTNPDKSYSGPVFRGALEEKEK